MKKTKANYEIWLNKNSPPQGDPKWIINNKFYQQYMHKSLYGTAHRKINKIGFDKGFELWKTKTKQ